MTKKLNFLMHVKAVGLVLDKVLVIKKQEGKQKVVLEERSYDVFIVSRTRTFFIKKCAN